jgi:hypothetical protein
MHTASKGCHEQLTYGSEIPGKVNLEHKHVIPQITWPTSRTGYMSLEMWTVLNWLEKEHFGCLLWWLSIITKNSVKR